MTTATLPTLYLKQMTQQYPGCWQAVDRLRASRGKAISDWPRWAFLPKAGYVDILRGYPEVFTSTPDELAVLAPWRVTQGIYDFHPEVLEAVRTTPMKGDIPVDVLYALPEWCVYIRTPGWKWGEDALDGIFAYLEWLAIKKERNLRIALSYNSILQPMAAISLNPGLIEQSLLAARALAVDEVKASPEIYTAEVLKRVNELPLAEAIKHVTPFLNLVLYICSKNCEIRDSKRVRGQPSNPPYVKTKQGVRIFPPNHPTVWEVGYRIGPALEAAKQQQSTEAEGGVRGSPRAHIRRAHWHSYWTGPKSDPKAELRWLSPIAVNVDEDHEVVPTVRSVGTAN